MGFPRNPAFFAAGRKTLAAYVTAALAFMAAAGCRISPVPPGPATPNRIVMGYYASWTRAGFDHTKVAYGYLTHIAHAFAWPDATGNLVVPPRFLYPELNAAAHANGVRMILSLGGWDNCAGFPGMSSTAENRACFIGQVVDFCEANGYDGVDVDWEFVSSAQEKANYVLFIESLGAALKARTPPLLLTMAAPANNYWGRWIDFERLSDDFDFIGLMTYDYHGAWSNHSGHNSPLHASGEDACGSVDATFAYLRGRQVPPGKLLVGLPFFGSSFDCGGWGQPFTKSEHLSYSEIMELPAAEWALGWDEKAQVPVMRRPDGTKIISFDDMRSVSLKCQYVKDKQAAGVIIWELSQDHRLGKPELLEVVGKSFSAR